MHNDGIVITDRWAEKGRREGKRWRARARDSRTQVYRSKAFADHDEALKWAREQRARFAAGVDKAGRLLMSQVVEDFVTDLIRRGGGSSYVKKLKVAMAEAQASGITDLRDPDLKLKTRAWLTGCTRKFGTGSLAPRTLNHYLKMLKAMVHYCMANDWLDRDVLYGVKIAVDPTKAKLREVYSVEELQMIVSEKHRHERSWLPACALVYFGLRIGEVKALDWSWFDWQGGVLNIRQKDDGWKPKHHRERRIIIMKEARDIFQPIAKLNGTVFPFMAKVRANKLSDWFPKYLQRIGLVRRGRAAHCARHTWISLRAAIGTASLVIQREAGHSSIVTTEHYMHAMPPGWVEAWPKDGQFWLRRSIAQPTPMPVPSTPMVPPAKPVQEPASDLPATAVHLPRLSFPDSQQAAG